jgi:hypothetical protein
MSIDPVLPANELFVFSISANDIVRRDTQETFCPVFYESLRLDNFLILCAQHPHPLLDSQRV